MEEGKEQHWTSTQAYALAVVCLLVGVITGYLLHTPARQETGAVIAGRAAEQQTSAWPANLETSATPQQKKSDADNYAQPLLASLEKNPQDAVLLAKIGAVYFGAHQFQTAQDYYSRSAAINSKDPSILIKLSSAYFYGGDGEKAIATLNQALEIDPKNADALFNVGVRG